MGCYAKSSLCFWWVLSHNADGVTGHVCNGVFYCTKFYAKVNFINGKSPKSLAIINQLHQKK